MNWMRIWMNRISNRGMEIREGVEMYRMALEYERDEMDSARIATEFWHRKSHTEQSQMLERGYDRALQTGRYHESHMLAVLNPYCQAPLTAMIFFVTEQSCRVRVYVGDGRLYSHTTGDEREHRVPVFGLQAGRRNTVTLELMESEGKVFFTKQIFLYSKALPKALSDMVLVRQHRAQSGSPFTFVYGGDARYPYAFDETGEIRYYLSRNPKAYGLFPISGGRFLFLVKKYSAPSFANPHSVLCQEMDFFGRVTREYFVPDGIHHDGCEMTPGGNLLLASSSENEYVEDTLIELERETGRVVKRLCLAEVLCEHPYFDYFDWAHINTVSYCPEDHRVLVCLRNLHTVMQLDWQTDEICWLFSAPNMWEGTIYEDKVLKPEGKISWCYQPHASYWLTEQGEGGRRRMIIYDNHWNKRRPVPGFDKDEKSYVRLYDIEEEKRTVTLRESYGDVKSKIRSNGIVKKDRVFSMSGYLVKPMNGYDGLITEFDRISGEVVNQYSTFHSFYRAYPFFADYGVLSQRMPEYERPVLGTEVPVWKICNPDIVKCAKRQPRFCLHKKARKDRKVVRKEERLKNYNEKCLIRERKQQISRVKISFYDDFLLVRERDHLVDKVYLGREGLVYEADYSRTEQKNPGLFSRFQYSLMMPIGHLPEGQYQVYIEVAGCVYRTGKFFSVVQKKHEALCYPYWGKKQDYVL